MVDLFAWSLLILQQLSDDIVRQHAVSLYNSLCRGCFSINNNDEVLRTRLVTKFVLVLITRQQSTIYSPEFSSSSSVQIKIVTRDAGLLSLFLKHINVNNASLSQSTNDLGVQLTNNRIVTSLTAYLLDAIPGTLLVWDEIATATDSDITTTFAQLSATLSTLHSLLSMAMDCVKHFYTYV